MVLLGRKSTAIYGLARIAIVGTFVVLATYSLYGNADESIKLMERYPSQSLITQIGDYFTESDQITVYYIPNANLGTPFPHREALQREWKYKFSYRCPTTCDRNAKKLQSFLASGLQLADACPDPFYALVELTSSEKQVARIYVQQSGHCFVLNDKSYHVEESFADFVRPSMLYPGIVR